MTQATATQIDALIEIDVVAFACVTAACLDVGDDADVTEGRCVGRRDYDGREGSTEIWTGYSAVGRTGCGFHGQSYSFMEVEYPVGSCGNVDAEDCVLGLYDTSGYEIMESRVDVRGGGKGCK